MESTLVSVRLPGVLLELERPADPEALLDERRFAEQDEFLPYWAESWASGETLAAHVAALALTGTRVLELGCGLGLPSLAAAARGAEVLATDWAPEAVELVRRNAARNDLALRAATRDWRDVAALVRDGPFDLLLAADVAYEARSVGPLVRTIVALGCPALVADPGRAHAATLLAALDAAGLVLETLPAPGLPRGGIHRVSPSGAERPAPS